ncbi:MAG: sugar ABC transporter substrate-binding protein, partial [Rhizobium sp.]
MKLKHISPAMLALMLSATALPGLANAKVVVLGWPGGSEETALRATTDLYNKTASDADKVELLFFNRDGFFDKLQADMAAGSNAFDVNLVATYSIGRYAPYMEPIELNADAPKVFGD